jgi:hypothetical protein
MVLARLPERRQAPGWGRTAQAPEPGEDPAMTTHADGALTPKQPNTHRQDEALWLVHRLNAALALVDRRATRWDVTLALSAGVLGLFALAGLMIWAAWR